MTSLIERIKNKKYTYMIATGVGIVAITFFWFGVRNNAYAISVGDEVIAVVKEKEEARLALEELVSTIKIQEGVDIALNEEVGVKPVHSKTKDIHSKDQAKDYLSSKVSYNIEAYEIIVDGETYAVVESEEIAFEVLSEIAKKHLSEGSGVKLNAINIKEEAVKENIEATPIAPVAGGTEKVEGEVIQPLVGEGILEIIEVQDALPNKEVKNEVKVAEVDVKEPVKEAVEEKKEGQKIERELKEFDFNEEVTVRNAYVKEEEVLTAEEAINILLSNTEEMQEYELKEGDNIWDIAVAHGTTMDHILEMNPQIVDETKMQIGEKIKLEVPEPILSISTVEQATFKELIPAEIEYVEFSDLYEDETKVYQEGNDGLKEITVNVHKINGKEVSRESVSEKLIKEPKIKVMAYGTKKKPKPVKNQNNGSSSSVKPSQSGQFMHPLNGAGRVSSGYGSRWGTYHRGIDIAAPAGTPIYAAASGTVAYSGYNNGGFGKMIILDHGNGYQTYYAHNSSLYVQVGQSVSKGQNIAGVGSTGDSTGNHVHFEIRKNGNPINPYGYIY